MIAALTAGGIAFLVSLAATPLVRRLALRLGATDQPDARRVHARPTPRAGGLAVAIAAAAGCAMGGAPAGGLAPGVAVGFGVVLLVGLLDDLLTLRPRIKLLGQGIAAAVATASGLRLGLLAPGGSGPLAAIKQLLRFCCVLSSDLSALVAQVTNPSATAAATSR